MTHKLYVFKSFLKETSIGIYLIAFLIPLYTKWLGFAVAFLILEQIVRKTPIKKNYIKSQINLKNPGIYLLLFYLMHIAGLIYTDNMKFAAMDLEMKATFVIFPLFFMLYRPRIDWDIFVRVFISGALISILINLILSYIEYSGSNNLGLFFGANISHFMHRGYWAIYLLIAMFLIAGNIFQNPSKKQFNLDLSGILIISVFVIFTQSKMGLIILIVLFAWFIVKLYRFLKNKWLFPALFLLFISLFYAAYNLSPNFSKRIKETISAVNKSEEEMNLEKPGSSQSRILLWKSSVSLIKENFWWGVGTGDIKDELIKRNLERGYTGIAKQEFNSHNQILNTQLAIGFFGTLFLIMSFVSNFIKQNRNENLIIMRWGITAILFAAMLTESMLEIEAGIIPYAFFISFLTAFEPFKFGAAD